MQNIKANLLSDLIQTAGDIPPPCFGHTLTKISSNFAVLFGGAIGSRGSYTTTNRCVLLDMASMTWYNLECTDGRVPSPRYHHAACALQDHSNSLIIHGGLSHSQTLASDDLYILHVDTEAKTGIWETLELQKGLPSPKRFGHSIVCLGSEVFIVNGCDGQEAIHGMWKLKLTSPEEEL